MSRDQAEQRAQSEALDRVLSVPPKIARVAADGWRRTAALEYVSAWLATSLDVLVLQGGTGSSKSMAAAWAFEFSQHRAPVTPMGHRRSPLWLDARALAAWSSFDGRFWSMFDNASLVVIDDAGIEESAERLAAAIERIVNVSTARCVITTNLGGKVFAERYGARVISRLRGVGQWVKVADPDFRTADARAELAARDRWPSPREQTPAERAIAEREAEERRLADEEHARTADARAVAAAQAMADFQAKIADLAGAKLSPFGRDERDEQFAERRRRAIDEAAAGERPAWEDG